MNRKGSVEFEKYPPIISKPSIKSWMGNFLIVFLLLCLAYFPFQGSNASKPYIATGINVKDLSSDSFGASMFWMLGGWIGLYLVVVMFHIIRAEFAELKAALARKIQ
jgi:multisubunit Na+/H+ antiporter MnhE subunit